MPKDKERSVNPAQAQRKLEKQKSLKKGKAEALARRNEKLARRNPDRIQRQINDLKSIEESGQQLRPHDKQILEALEKDLRAVQKAREALGDKAPKFGGSESRRGGFGGRGRGDGGVLGKRRRDERSHFGQESDSSETDEDVRRIPMPRDTPPPIPREYQRRRGTDQDADQARTRGPHPLPAKPAVTESKTVYEAKPEIRDLRKEAISKFVPAAVRAKQEAIRGQGKLLEPEEMDKLEKAGYQASLSEGAETSKESLAGQDPEELQRLQEEEERFNRELRSVQIEEVEDEEA
ncbi:conserved hypothetical protein [Aspergillus terreus NIH2624]|jgi:hypothetical protein|uniref:Wbp11/ELF5/Saf1 N-terminal domain-containing protein n=1 Tax=Aspergillus terreus (strain NIH 2624 / FGSC A1156) TaxID=341663 RepID=Q0CGK1_ASPTN|nr:uncharacterized protein ATEG_07191 [Aspergillus terreus NIH2624]EAU32575.1 conserved hypothetical protein [Aspergillus terreus NIH2624]